MQGRAITVAVNGAEYLELEDGCAKNKARSVPQHVRALCDLGATTVSSGAAVKITRGRPVRLALERRTVTILVTDDEYATLDAGATAAGLSIPQYVRTRCGFEVRWVSNPRTEDRDREEDDAWNRLRRLGLDPELYFPPET